MNGSINKCASGIVITEIFGHSRNVPLEQCKSTIIEKIKTLKKKYISLPLNKYYKRGKSES